MIQGKRSRVSPTEKNDIWRRWKCGQSLHEIGRAYGRPHPTIRKLLLPSGGIPPMARRRSRSCKRACQISFGFDHGVFQTVYSPSGSLVGGSYPEAAAHLAILHVHRTQILDSPTFKGLYFSVLKQVVKESKDKPELWEKSYIKDIRLELTGKFKLPTPGVPVPVEPPISVERTETAPRDANFQPRQLHIPLGAMRYLEGN